MVQSRLIRVDDELVRAMENIRRNIALKTKQEFGLKTIEIPGTEISRILGKKLNLKQSQFLIKVKKISGKNGSGRLTLQSSENI